MPEGTFVVYMWKEDRPKLTAYRISFNIENWTKSAYTPVAFTREARTESDNHYYIYTYISEQRHKIEVSSGNNKYKIITFPEDTVKSLEPRTFEIELQTELWQSRNFFYPSWKIVAHFTGEELYAYPCYYFIYIIIEYTMNTGIGSDASRPSAHHRLTRIYNLLDYRHIM